MTDRAAPSPAPAYRRYGAVWSVRPVRWAFTGTLIARAAQTMMPLTLLLVVRQRTGSFAAAGIAVAVFGLASVAGGPLTARLADRQGSPVLAGAGAVNAAGLVFLAVAEPPGAASAAPDASPAARKEDPPQPLTIVFQNLDTTRRACLHGIPIEPSLR